MASNDTDRVSFGLSNVHVGTYTVGTDGTVTMGTPMHIPGAVTLSLEPEGDNNDFYADNTKYWSGYSDNGFSGTLEMARFPDEFRTTFMGAKKLDDGGIADVKSAAKPAVYIAYQGEGDKLSRREILYNVTLSGIKKESKTTEDSTEPETESIDITVTGDNATGFTHVTYNVGDAGYDTIFTKPPAPKLPTGA